ncbi:MAG: HIT family protein [Candidatus Aenigmatarchaeota archaeon]
MNGNCTFCKIVEGEVPAWKIYEDEHFLAFMGAFPITEGHSLVIPKEHYPEFLDLPEHELKHLLRVVQEVADGVVEATDADGFNLLQSNNPVAGQEIFHVHFHIIPRYHGDSVEMRWEESELEDEQAEALLKDIRECM